MSVGLILLYALPWMSDSWTPRRILWLETLADCALLVPWLVAFSVTLGRMQGHCLSASVTGAQGGNTEMACTNFNWMCTWFFLTAFAYGMGAFFDAASWYKALFAEQEVDSRIMMDIRRSTRSLNTSGSAFSLSRR
jgi:hypothetical protein